MGITLAAGELWATEVQEEVLCGPQAGGRAAEWRWRAVGSFVTPEGEEERTEGRLGLGLEVSNQCQRNLHR